MNSYQFTFVVSGFDINDDDQLDALHNAFEDVSASVSVGRTELSFVVDAGSAQSALISTYSQLRHILPQTQFLYLDEDLVAVPDIAVRTGRTAESIRLLTTGERGAGEFPTPVGVLGGGSRLWRWSDVCTWFKAGNKDFSNGAEFINRYDEAMFVALQDHEAMPQIQFVEYQAPQVFHYRASFEALNTKLMIWRQFNYGASIIEELSPEINLLEIGM